MIMIDIKDVKPPVYLFDFGLLLWVLLALMGVAVGIFVFLRYQKSRPAPKVAQIPDLPAWEKAYQQLEALQRENLLDKGLYKEFFTKVADIVRHYMENRFKIHAPHMTTEEFLNSLGKSGHLNDTQKISLTDFLNSCDMVKFAKYLPTDKEALTNFDLAKKLVDDTKT